MILDVDDRRVCVHDAEVGDGIDARGDVVARDHVLGHGRHAPDEGAGSAANGQVGGERRLQQQPCQRDAGQRDGDTGCDHCRAGSAGPREGEHDARGQCRRRTGAERAV